MTGYLPRAMTDATSSSTTPAAPADEVARRRTFAIISHPDAGKTTLTEKFLLFGGAIQMAGQVRAKGEARRTRSDFMQMEKERGISVSASATARGGVRRLRAAAGGCSDDGRRQQRRAARTLA